MTAESTVPLSIAMSSTGQVKSPYREGSSAEMIVRNTSDSDDLDTRPGISECKWQTLRCEHDGRVR